VSVGLLLLSRSLAPVYVAAFAVAVGVDLLRRRRFCFRQTALAVLIAGAVAGPWWLVSGGTALHYLTSAGYQRSSGLTNSGAHLSLSSIVDRTQWTVGDLGTVQSIFLLAAPLIALTRIRRMPGALVVSAWLLLTLVGLATSSNIGTGFGLPILAVAITLGGSLLLGRPHPAAPPVQMDPAENGSGIHSEDSGWRNAALTVVLFAVAAAALLLVGVAVDAPGSGVTWALVAAAAILAGTFMRFRPAAIVGLVVILIVGFAAEWSGGKSLSWLGPPYRRMAEQAANGASVPNIDAVHREVARAIAGGPALLIRDDDLLNGNGLRYAAIVGHLPQTLVSAPFGDAKAGVRELKDADYLIAGASPAPYHDYASVAGLAAARAGWEKVRVWRLACGNTIDLWQKPSSPVRPGRARSYEAAVLSDAPAAFWRLGDTTCDAVDASGNDNLGAYIGNPGFDARSLIVGQNPAVRLDGKDDQVTFPGSATLTVRRAISLEAWVRPDDVPTASGSGWQLVSRWNTALLYVRGGPAPKFVFAVYDTRTSSYTPHVVSSTTVAAHRTYDVVGTYDGAKLRIYVNGVLESAVDYSGSLAGSGSKLGGAIGYKGWGDLPSPRFRGILDEVAIYAHALAARRVRGHYRAGTTSSTR
jgi:hypothetical protein